MASYVALGDSFAAGLGNGPYASAAASPIAGTGVTLLEPGDSARDGCQRSMSPGGAYPTLVAARLGLASLVNAACSGASVGSLESTYQGEPAQLRAVGASTTLVTISVGGDDAPAFMDVVGACASLIVTRGRRAASAVWRLSHLANVVTCSAAVNLKRAALVARDEASLVKLYESVLARMSPQGRVVVVAYPQLAALGARRACQASATFAVPRTSWGESLGFSPADYERLAGLLQEMNQTIATALSTVALAAPGRILLAAAPVSVDWFRCGPVSKTSAGALRGIQVSSTARPPGWSSAWMAPCRLLWRAGPTRVPYAACASGVWAARLLSLAGQGQSIVSDGSLHPNETGQAVLAGAVLSALASPGA